MGRTHEGVISYCNLSCGYILCCLRVCARGLLKGQDSFIWAEINIKWWPSSINPFVRPSNSSPEMKAVVRGARAGSRMAERERNVWAEVAWWMGKLLHHGEDVSFIASCLSLVASCFFYGSDYRADAWTNSSLRDPHQPYKTHADRNTSKLDSNLPQQAGAPPGQRGHAVGKS